MKVGIVGGGQIATVHIPYVRSYAGAEVVGLTDTDEGRAKTTAARFGIANTTRTLAELIDWTSGVGRLNVLQVAAIAQKAGVNKAMINYHFGGKRKLYLAILSATFAEIVEGVERLAESLRPAPEVLRDLVAMVGEVATRRHPHFCTMMLREVVAGGKHLESEVMDKPVRMLEAVQSIVARGVREGDFRPVDPLLTHLSLVGSLVFFFATRRFRERVFAKRRPTVAPPAPDAYVKYIQELLTHGLAAPRADGGQRP
jgi:TetR/AcrR family transcriptional regulator